VHVLKENGGGRRRSCDLGGLGVFDRFTEIRGFIRLDKILPVIPDLLKPVGRLRRVLDPPVFGVRQSSTSLRVSSDENKVYVKIIIMSTEKFLNKSFATYPRSSISGK